MTFSQIISRNSTGSSATDGLISHARSLIGMSCLHTWFCKCKWGRDRRERGKGQWRTSLRVEEVRVIGRPLNFLPICTRHHCFGLVLFRFYTTLGSFGVFFVTAWVRAIVHTSRHHWPMNWETRPLSSYGNWTTLNMVFSVWLYLV
jgi:hypothetical protein